MRPMCAGMVDQGRRIGGDPVGHKCSRTAESLYWIDGLSWHVCDDCKRHLDADDGRVQLPLWAARAGEG